MQPINDNDGTLSYINKILLVSFLTIVIIASGAYLGYQYMNSLNGGISQSNMVPPTPDKINSDEQNQALSKLGASSKTNIKEEDKASLLKSLNYKNSINTNDKVDILNSLK